ncbi:SHOCT domain-containing protein [Mycolicibacterium fluoranthenivorans]|uniref:Putative membrane protein n=1 Tax=Mycolicibacterium fluoranthenivorans TaxID=258505 RepID=A0A7X5U1C9_9MYCO|nr:SHOCT domain-containing protein [Mycolicibacterium fluoranthenivorans]MCV7354835.1 SHOCT domain-containing protein [Mycolicibacterium fluoranthenivorans]NIH96578.1 putative membrane protein [Mycolicibacterium fluoranthenivorans]
MTMYFDHDMGWWGYAGMGIGMVVFSAAILFGIIVAVIYAVRDRSAIAPPPPPTATEILAARFARGEIDEAEYGHRMALLRSSAQH